MQSRKDTRFEKARLIGSRALQISMGAKPLVEFEPDEDTIKIAIQIFLYILNYQNGFISKNANEWFFNIRISMNKNPKTKNVSQFLTLYLFSINFIDIQYQILLVPLCNLSRYDNKEVILHDISI